ncbi:hypothetical protein Shyhy01_74150 [Streptomyces hygroscopicus subsp. hygroscopicus]|nr:hypothetical protein [Streptomyces hygroscopicus]GLX54466.1 hypothetical protein Shyhy01_74150 [Streptomyces hygroscopicus subsp. hygroscopicus]
MTPTAQAEGPRIVGEALAMGVRGDLESGVDLIVPLIAADWGSAYALACMLAEAASYIARRDQEPGTVFGMPVQNTETGEWASADVLPPHLRFAGQFTTAWANRDRAHAEAMFTALYERSPGGSELVDGLLMLFQMAVCTSEKVVAEEWAKRGQGSGS